MQSQEVDPSVDDQRYPLGRMDEQFTHGLGCRRDGAHPLVPVEVLGRQGVFEEEQPEWLQLPREVDGIGRRQA